MVERETEPRIHEDECTGSFSGTNVVELIETLLSIASRLRKVSSCVPGREGNFGRLINAIVLLAIELP